MSDAPQVEPTPDLDLFEYMLVCVPSSSDLSALAGSLVALVESRVIRLVDVVVLERARYEVDVKVSEAADLPELGMLVTHGDGRIMLSSRDVDLAAVTLAPGMAALLLLVEDRWASLLASAARHVGGGVAAGERIPRERLRDSVDHEDIPGRVRVGRRDLICRSPLSPPLAPGWAPAVDQAEQVRNLARLVGRGVLSMEQYELQRRRVLTG